MKYLKLIQDWIYQQLVTILLVISVTFLSISYSDCFSASISEVFEKFGFAILSSGVFAAVLKSIQFTGIFKRVIEEIILGSDFIENRSKKNQLDLWKTTSKAIYKRKFPELSDYIEEAILETYLPTKKEYYYRDYVMTINIKEINDDFELSYTQTSKYEIVLDSGIDKTKICERLEISQENNNSNYINNIEFFIIDGIKQELMPTVDNDNPNIQLIEYEIEATQDKRVFKIEKRYVRKYSLRNENYKLIRMATFTKGMDVLISFPKEINVSFFNIGNKKLFEKLHEDVEGQMTRSHKNDVLLPYQGFGLSFDV